MNRIPSEAQKLLEETWLFFGQYHAYYLSDMTHLEFPWKKARKDLPPEAASTEPILLEDMRLLVEEKLEEIECEHPAYEPVMIQILQDAFSEEPTKTVNRGEVRGWLESLFT